MALMSRTTGEVITDEEHLRQSIMDIILTPLGSRVAVRDYGCMFYDIIDRPFNRKWVIDSFIAIASALRRWEPRYALNLIQIDCSQLADGVVNVTLTGIYKPLGRVLVLQNIRLDFGVPA